MSFRANSTVIYLIGNGDVNDSAQSRMGCLIFYFLFIMMRCKTLTLKQRWEPKFIMEILNKIIHFPFFFSAQAMPKYCIGVTSAVPVSTNFGFFSLTPEYFTPKEKRVL